MALPFTLSVETDACTYQHGFHLGTDERLARQIAEEFYYKAIPKYGKVVKTVALLGKDKPIIFDGDGWSVPLL